jgi:SAM-dependent methyltransferase
MTRTSSIDWERDIYAQGRQLNRWPFSDVVSALIRHTGTRAREEIRVLEIGCGAGNNVWFLAEEGFIAHGVDGSASAIAHARSRLDGRGLRADLRVGDMTALPYPDEFFDYVLDRGAVTQNDYASIRAIFAEVHRVLKPSGVFMLFDLFGMDHPDRPLGKLVSENTYDHFSGGSFSHVGLTSFFTFADLSTLLGAFSHVQIVRNVRTNSSGRIFSDCYEAVATKPATAVG